MHDGSAFGSAGADGSAFGSALPFLIVVEPQGPVDVSGVSLGMGHPLGLSPLAHRFDHHRQFVPHDLGRESPPRVLRCDRLTDATNLDGRITTTSPVPGAWCTEEGRSSFLPFNKSGRSGGTW